MTAITHHLPPEILAAYATGALPYPFALVAATHVSLCAECRAEYEAHQCAGGAVLETMGGAALSAGLRARMLDAIDAEPRGAAVPAGAPRGRGIYPGPLAELLDAEGPRWRTLGAGVRQQILAEGESGSVRLLAIPPGRAMPDHGHRGLELTLVLQGAFHDETGAFHRGDVEVGEPALTHTPTAAEGETCICLAATDAPLKFNSLIPRLLQPIFRI